MRWRHRRRREQSIGSGKTSPKWRRQKLPRRRMRLGSVHCRMSLEQIAQKEKSYVVDYHCNSGNLMAARLFGWEHKSKLPENRQLDSHSARCCPHPHRSERAACHLDPRFVENRRGGQIGCLFRRNIRPVDWGQNSQLA
jgi:hypothetical protein